MQNQITVKQYVSGVKCSFNQCPEKGCKNVKLTTSRRCRECDARIRKELASTRGSGTVCPHCGGKKHRFSEHCRSCRYESGYRVRTASTYVPCPQFGCGGKMHPDSTMCYKCQKNEDRKQTQRTRQCVTPKMGYNVSDLTAMTVPQLVRASNAILAGKYVIARSK